MKKKIIIIFLLIAFLAGMYYYFSKSEKKIKPIKIKQKIEKQINHKNKFNKEEMFSKQEKIKNESKKYDGEMGDKLPPEIVELNQIGDIIDYKENIFPKIKLKIKDNSGIYRVRILFFHNGEKIGYYQKNPNTDKKNIEVSFNISNNIILDDFKTFLDYEGATINYKINILDNNMNQKSENGTNQIKIIDNTKPEKVIGYWTYYFDEEYEDFVYNKEEKNVFTIYRINDFPKLEENKIKKYQIRIEDDNNELLFRAGIQPFAESKKDVSLNIPNDGNYTLFLKGYDLNENYNEKIIKFGIDRTEPVGKLYLVNGLTYNPNEKIEVEILAKDNLSGIFRYRIADTRDNLLASQWKDIEKLADFPGNPKEGIFDIVCQVQDNAFNNSKIFQASYYVNVNKNLIIKCKSNEREKILEVKKQTQRNGKIQIMRVEEK